MRYVSVNSFDYLLTNLLIACSNPPLDEDKVPDGEWVCHRCVVTGNFKVRPV